MSITLIHAQIQNFLKSPSPEVIAIKGHWGVGKTFAWNAWLNEAKANGQIGLTRYSYVSLFGINSLDDLKQAIFQNTVNKSSIGESVGLETLLSDPLRIGRKLTDLTDKLPFTKGYAQSMQSIAFFSVKETIICLDDLERRGDKLSDKDIMGLVSQLKEQKACKVVLLFNNKAGEFKHYNAFREKVVDKEFKLKPTAKEAVNIAFADLSYQKESLNDYALRLDLRNIRILNKIKHYAELLEPLLKGYQLGLVASALHSLVLYTWCFYGHGKDKPDLDYVVNIGFGKALFKDKDKLSKQHKRWNASLANYGYRDTSPLDRLIAQGVKRGYFENPRWKKTADEYNQQFTDAELNKAFDQAWSLFHDTFDNNQTEFINLLYVLSHDNIKKLTTNRLHSSVSILRDLGEVEKADELIELYIQAYDQPEDIERFNLEEINHFGDLKDSVLPKRFDEHYNTLIPQETIEEVLGRIAGKDGWSKRDIVILSRATASEYEALLRRLSGENLTLWVRTLLGFGRFANPDEQYQKIYNQTVEALKRIAKDSEYNKRRMQKFKLNLED